ncbi:filamentous hemagglutinin N-terminal domain-containing protein [Methylocystis bryophila]|uniref:Filamentous haemagglutinin FhaB/tRNA nuclease CdiA-like TPS domain-containing protein n=1 Tax=Methylocystis bryophila TaxID=655015 RepID=A0A1W6MQG6_9HYPH|nr:filamentous hemagglutinin N-terminal domain-containing protein [Methylocystis bryophila]ARN79843.1 hypothetical protein B1812_00775 [Methylocystis bryophila]BDV39730.1 hypothetical protein DSM21852_29830 [Methylocystis bryophila]
MILLSGLCALLPGRPSLAAPQGGVVVSGQANISANGATTTINQSTNQAIINWQLFSIAPKETVNFNQPGPTSVTLNRVIGNEKSVIEGALNANGQVFIVNSAGIVFTKSAQVNVGGLVASTLDISNNNFMAGKYQFSGKSTASVVNQGNIQTSPGGYVALLGNTVSNQGTITATLGTVAMASGEQVTLNIGGNALVEVTTDKGTLNALVENKGAIIADGGKVVLTARAADALLSAQVNNSGVIQARTMAGLMGEPPRTGSIKLVANGGKVKVAGRLDASAPNGGNGGTIETSGAKVTVADNAVVTTQAASGKKGLWLIDPDGFTIASSGGDITGVALSSQLDSTNVSILSTSGSGTDGNINVNAPVSWSADTTLALNATNNINVNAPITATGAGAGLTLNSGMDVNVNAVDALNVPTIGGAIGHDFNIQQAQDWTTPPDLTGLTVANNFNVNAPVTWSTGALTLAAANNINIGAPVTATGAGAALTLNAGMDVNVNAVNALNVPTIGGLVNHDFNIGQAQDWTTLPNLAGLTVANNFNVNAPVTWTGALTLAAANNVNVNAPLSWSAGTLTLNAGKSVNVNAVMTVSGAGNFAANYGYVLDGNGNPTTTPTAGANADGSSYGLYTGFGWNGGYGGRIDFSGSGAVALNGQNYTVISSEAGLIASGSNLSGNYVLGSDVAISSLTEIPLFTGNFNGFGHSLPVSTQSINAPLSIATLQNTNVVVNSQGDISINAPVTSGAGMITFNARSNINVNAPITETGAIARLIFNAPYMSVNIGAPITMSGSSAILTLNAGVYGNINAVNALNVPTINGTVFDLNFQQAQAWTTPPNLTGLTVRGDVAVNAPLAWSTGTLRLASGNNINLAAPLNAPSAGLMLNAGYSVNVNAANALNVATIGGYIPVSLTIQQAQAWTTPPDLTGLTINGNLIVNAPLTWSSGTLALAAAKYITLAAPLTATGAGSTLALNAGADVNVYSANALNVATIGGTIGHDFNIEAAQAWTTAPSLTGLTVANNVNVEAPLTWSTGALTLAATNNINIAAPITATGAGTSLALNAGVDVNVNAVNALNVATIGGLVNHDFNIQQSQAWTTPPVLTGLTVANNFNVNAPVTWSTGSLTLAATNNVNVNTPLNWSTGTLTLNAGQSVYVNGVLTVSGAGNFAANYGYVLDGNGNPTTTPTPGVNPDGSPYGLYTGFASTGQYAGRIDFSGAGAVALNGQNYTVINSDAGFSALGSNPSGDYVLGSNVAVASLAQIPLFTGDFNGFGHKLSVAPVSTLSIDAPLSIATLKNANVVLNTSGDISINAPVTSGAGLLTFNAGGAINLNASLQSASDSFGSFAFTGKSMALETTASVSGGNVFINAPTSWSSNAVLTLTATDNINVNAPITATGATAGLVLTSGNNPSSYININAPIVLTGANASLALNTYVPVSPAPAQPIENYSFGKAGGITLNGANPSLTINGNSYQIINTLAQLEAISPNASSPANGFYALGSDINAGGGVVFSGPVINDLEGTFAGFNHVIRYLTITDPTFSNYDALIGVVGQNTGLAAVVRDVGLQYVNVSSLSADTTMGSSTAALVAGNNGTINNTYAWGGSISGYSAGGLVATNTGNINNSWTFLNVTGVFDAGGLAAVNNPNFLTAVGGNINNSYANGPVTAVGSTTASGGLQGAAYAGGLVGYNSGNISNSHATGTVTATDLIASIGGLVGENNNSFGPPGEGVISNSYATGNVNVLVTNQYAATQGVGGLVGTNNGGYVTGSQASGNITVAATNPETTFAADVGGLVGLNESGFFGTGGNIDHSSAGGSVTAVVGNTFGVGGLVGGNIDPFTSITTSSATGAVNSNFPNSTGGLIGGATSGANYGGNSWSISGTGQTSATGSGPGDATAGATGTNPSQSSSSTTQSISTPINPFVDQTQAANVVSTVDTSYSASTPPRPRVAASAGTGKTSALAGPSFSDRVSSPTNQTEGERLQRKQATDAANARAKAASLSAPPSHSKPEPEAKEAPPPRRHVFTPPPPVAKPKGAGFGATIHSIEIEGKQYELHEKSGSKPQPPENKPQAPESKPQGPEIKTQAPESKPQAPETKTQAPSDHK